MLAQHYSLPVAGAGLDIALDISIVSTCGPRPENQDNFLVTLPHPAGGRVLRSMGQRPVDELIADWPAYGVRVAVMDGMGGHADGREAAETLARALAGMPFQTDPAGLRSAVMAVHAELRQSLRGPDERRGGSTLVLADLDLRAGRAVRIHVGDSRGYLWHRAAWRRLTHDHRTLEFAWRDGLLPAGSPAGPPMRFLAQAMGFGHVAPGAATVSPGLRIDLPEDLRDEAVGHADASGLRIERGDRLLLTTDGLLGDDDGAAALADLALDPSLPTLIARASAGAKATGDNATGISLTLSQWAA